MHCDGCRADEPDPGPPAIPNRGSNSRRTHSTEASILSAGPAPAPNRRATVAPALWRAGQFLLDWSPILIVLFVYDVIHNRLGPLLPPAHFDWS